MLKISHHGILACSDGPWNNMSFSSASFLLIITPVLETQNAYLIHIKIWMKTDTQWYLICMQIVFKLFCSIFNLFQTYSLQRGGPDGEELLLLGRKIKNFPTFSSKTSSHPIFLLIRFITGKSLLITASVCLIFPSIFFIIKYLLGGWVGGCLCVLWVERNKNAREK